MEQINNNICTVHIKEEGTVNIHETIECGLSWCELIFHKIIKELFK